MAAAAVRIVIMNVVGLFVMMMAVVREAALVMLPSACSTPPVREVLWSCDDCKPQARRRPGGRRV